MSPLTQCLNYRSACDKKKPAILLTGTSAVNFRNIMNYAVTRDPVPRSRKLVHYNISLTNNHIKSAYCQNCQLIVKLIVDFNYN